MKIIVVGAGIFGVTAAIELRKRGHHVILVERTAIPNQYSASFDISKVVRLEYGSDEFYTDLMVLAMDRWQKFNEQFNTDAYHNTGVLVLKQKPIERNSFDELSRSALVKRGIYFERLNSDILGQRFPLWNNSLYVDGHYNPVGGWVESGKMVEVLGKYAIEIGVEVVVAEMDSLIVELKQGKQVTKGIVTKDKKQFLADHVVVSAGSWTSSLLPHLKNVMWPTAQIVFHFQPENPQEFMPPTFPTYLADTTKTGFYGFPAHPSDGRVKLGHHGPGYPIGNLSNKEIDERLEQVKRDAEKEFRRFIKQSFPKLSDSPVVQSRLCIYCDTFDGDFWIDNDETIGNLTVAAGGSGHAFKFGTVIGEIIADVVDQKPNKYKHKFQSRPVIPRKENLRAASNNTSTTSANL
eukprot:TRINITY_DN3360_c0_g1_i3.p1 TRINITY_DN3360_c0_g1~~TRINITY_DN3360_c0_g1_i3.p1  ORF type:complete len:407 (-),score=78.71 TRINITY_DN3360_c0_g1_i3:106-1326(-)